MEIPNMLTIPQIVKKGVLPEHMLRRMVREKTIPAIYSGTRCYINYSTLCEYLNEKTAIKTEKAE